MRLQDLYRIILCHAVKGLCHGCHVHFVVPECIRTQLRNHFQNLRSPAIIANNASVFVKGLIKVSKENARKRQKLCVNSRHFPYRFSKLTKDLRRCIHALKA